MKTAYRLRQRRTRIPLQAHLCLRASRLTAMIAMFLLAVVMPVQGGSMNVRSGSLALAAPANDDFGNATALVGDSGTLTDETTESATAEAGEPSHDSLPFTPSHSVWYDWTPSTSGNAVIEVVIPFSGDWDPVLAVYTGSAVNALTETASTHTTGYRITMEMRVDAGTIYRVAVDGYDSTESGLFDLIWSIPSPPNDDFADATLLPGNVGTLVDESNAWATAEASEPSHDGLTFTPARSVWYEWTPATTATAEIGVSVPFTGDWDPVLAIYTGSAVNALTEIASTHTTGYGITLLVPVQAGTTYRIAVDGYDSTESGLFDLTWSIASPNDNFADAIVLGGDAGTLVAETNENATAEPGEPAHAGYGPARSVWYQWTPSSSGNAIVLATTQPYPMWDIVVGVYTGTAVYALTEVTSEGGLVNQVEAEFRVTAGTTYRIAVAGQTSNETGEFDLTWSIPSPPNDDFANAIDLTGEWGWQLGDTNQWASAEPGELAHAGRTPTRSVWYRWRPPADGTAVVTGLMHASDYIIVAAYTGSSVGALTEVAAHGGNGFSRVRMEFPVLGGTEYSIVLDGWDESETGSFDLTWALSPPANDDFANPTVLELCDYCLHPGAGSLVGESSHGATPEIGELPHAGVPGTPARSVWYEWTAKWDGDATIDVSIPPVPDDWDGVVAVYTGNSLDALTEVASGSTTGDLMHLAFATDRNATYRIVVDSYGNDDFGTFDLAWTYDPYGGTWNVTKTEDTDDGACDADCSLREAVVAANDTGGDDTIYLPAGTYELTLDSDIVAEHYGSLDVHGGAGTTSILGAGRDVTIIDATTLRTLGMYRPDRVFAVGYEGGLDLVGVTTTGGHTENHLSADNSGGGIWNMNGYLTVSDCIVEGNVAGEGGGGIANHVGPATINNTIIRNNTTDAPDYTADVNYGGGIQNTGTMIITDSEVTGNSTNQFGFGGGMANAGLLDVIDTTISGNDAPVGGGIGSDYAGTTSGDAWIATVTNSAIVDNHADSNGGGISNSGGGILNPGTDVTTILIDSLVSGNTADGDGGGIHNDAGVVEVHRTTVRDNFADGGGSGGGILNGSGYTWMTGNLIVSNSTLSGNGATYGGGITNLDRGATVISDTTVSNNISFSGGGIDNGGFDSSTVTAKNTIIAGNDSLALGSEDCSGAVTSLGYNLVGDGTGCPADGVGDILTIDPLLSPLLDFGGSTETHALLPGSPAINAGTTDLSIDQRGVPRPQGPADDIGAFEVEHGPNAPPVLGGIGDLAVDEGDTLDVPLSASDTDGDDLVFWVEGAPGFVVLHDHGDGTAVLSVTPAFLDAGSYPGVAIYVSDGVDVDKEIITIDVMDGNAVPVAEDQSVETWQDNPVEITLTGSDVDGDELAYAIFEPPAHGDLAGTPPAVIYIPDSGFVGADSFTFTVFDGNATSIPGTVSIAVHNIRPDPTFGTDGTYISTFGGYGGAYAVVEQADGTILVAGWVRPTGARAVANANAVVAKITPDGTLDSTFGTGGVAVVSGRDNYFYDLVVEPDGQIVAVGKSQPAPVLGGDPLIARFEADGTLDTGFGTSGLVMPDLNGQAATVALQPDGKIVVGGGWGTYDDLGVARLLVNGDLDLAFGTDGVTTVRHAGNDLVSEVLVQPDGSILLVGTIDSFNEWNEQDISLVRLLTDGSPDTTFGDDGEVIIDLGMAESGYGVALQADGKIVIAGDTLEPFNRDAIVVRTTSTGDLDPTFGSDGVANIAFGGDFDQFNDLVLLDGTIVVAGSSGAEGSRDFIVARVLSDGSLDQTFDYDGKVSHDLGDDDAAWALAVQTDGKLLLAGETGAYWAVLRLMDAGTNQVPVLDPIGDPSLAEADTLDVAITASDADDDPLFFSLSGEADFAALMDHGDGTATLSLTPGFDDAGVYPGVVVIVSDRLASDSQMFTITVTNTNQAPVLAAIGNQSVVEGGTLSVTITASDSDGDSLSFGIRDEPAFATLVDHGDGTASLSLSPGVNTAGVYQGVAITVSDSVDIDSETFTITVTVEETEYLFLPLVLRSR